MDAVNNNPRVDRHLTKKQKLAFLGSGAALLGVLIWLNSTNGAFQDGFNSGYERGRSKVIAEFKSKLAEGKPFYHEALGTVVYPKSSHRVEAKASQEADEQRPWRLAKGER